MALQTFLRTLTFLLVRLKGRKSDRDYLKPAIKLVDWISEVDTLPLSQKLTQLRLLLQTEVVSNKVSIDTVLPPLFGVEQDVWGWWTKVANNSCEYVLHQEESEEFWPLQKTHPPLSSAHISSWQWIFSRTSGWSWQTCRTFFLSSPQAGKATGDK